MRYPDAKAVSWHGQSDAPKSVIDACPCVTDRHLSELRLTDIQQSTCSDLMSSGMMRVTRSSRCTDPNSSDETLMQKCKHRVAGCSAAGLNNCCMRRPRRTPRYAANECCAHLRTLTSDFKCHSPPWLLERTMQRSRPPHSKRSICSNVALLHTVGSRCQSRSLCSAQPTGGHQPRVLVGNVVDRLQGATLRCWRGLLYSA
jgi:hypothetical protein